MKFPIQFTLSFFSLFGLSVSWALPSVGAERIAVSSGTLQRSLPIDSLATYARTGKADRQLAPYMRSIDEAQATRLRQVLLTRLPLNEVQVSQFLYTPIGSELLERLSSVIRTRAEDSQFYALRAAFILAAADEEGLTLLNVLRQFPLETLQIDLARVTAIASDLDTLINQTNRAVALVNQASTQASTQAATQITTAVPANVTLANLEAAGPVTWTRQTLTIRDRSRNRTIPTDLYLPQNSAQNPAASKISVVVISHGLGSDRSTFAYLAQHLASYGFAVAVPEHAGSNSAQLEALLAGRADRATPPAELVDRPLDVSAVLDTLTQLAQADPTFQGQVQGRLNLEQVGVVGQSFGGYTALAVAGAPLNFTALQQNCQDTDDTLNPSLLLQCLALELPIAQPNFRTNYTDPRIRAAIAINPLSSSIFGQASLSQIQVPVMLIAGSNDTVTPALPEQIRPFSWLTTPEKYLVVINNATHFSAPDSTPNDPVPIPAGAIGPNPALARRYINALNVAFFQSYIGNQPQYRALLSPANVTAISRQPLAVSLVQALTPTQLAAAIEQSVQ